MKIVIEKPSPKWLKFKNDDGKTEQRRVLGILGYVEIGDFPDALSFDGGTMELLRPFEYEKMQMENGSAIPQNVLIDSTIMYLEGCIADLREHKLETSSGNTEKTHEKAHSSSENEKYVSEQGPGDFKA